MGGENKRLVDLTRFEIMPFGKAEAEAEAAALPERVRLTVTCSVKHGIDHSVDFAKRLRAQGHRITMHMAARTVRDRPHLDQLLEALAQAGIDDIFLIGGDAPVPHGPYSSALDLLPIIHEHSHRPRTIGIGGYPEGHPLIDSATLADTLKRKSPFTDYIATQLCFNPATLLAWIETIRQAGIGLPIFVGVPGVVDRRQLLEIAMRVGVGPSIGFLRKQGGIANLLRLSAGSLDDLYASLAPHLSDERLGIAGFHYFTFNRLAETWRWERAHARTNPLNSSISKEVEPI